MGWFWRETLTFFSDVEQLFVLGRIPSSRSDAPEPKPARPRPEASAHAPKPTPPLFGGPIPDWMQPAPSGAPRKALPMEVVAALMALGLASPPARDDLKRMIRRALANAHPDRHPPEDHAQMRQRLHEIQGAREVLRRHGYA